MTLDRQISGVVALATFRHSLKKLKDPNIRQATVKTVQGLLLLGLDELPRKLHLHQLTSLKVDSAVEPGKKVNVWSLHVTADDRYKASFTFEGGVIYLRLVDEHDVIDKHP